MSMDYGDDYLDEISAAHRARHARPGARRQVPPLVRRMALWCAVYAIVAAVGLVVLALYHPMFRLDFPRETPTTSQTAAP